MHSPKSLYIEWMLSPGGSYIIACIIVGTKLIITFCLQVSHANDFTTLCGEPISSRFENLLAEGQLILDAYVETERFKINWKRNMNAITESQNFQSSMKRQSFQSEKTTGKMPLNTG